MKLSSEVTVYSKNEKFIHINFERSGSQQRTDKIK